MNRLAFMLMLLPVVLALPANGQQVTVQITQIAGEDIYLNAGQDAGILTADTLLVFRNNEQLGRLVVVFSSSSQSVTTFADAPFPLTRGGFLNVLLPDTRPPQNEQPPPVTEPQADATPSTPEQPVVRPPVAQRPTERWRTSGRLLVNFYGMRSVTGPVSAGATSSERIFITPSLSLNSTIQPPGGHTRVRVNLRSDYRHSNLSRSPQTGLFRAYQLNVERTFALGSLQAGRFYHYRTPLGGYWDGVSFMWGSRRRGVGASVGFMPERRNEGFSTQFPRFSAFANWRASVNEDGTYDAAVSYHEIHPSSQYLTHRYVGLSQDFRLGIVRLNQELQADQDPMSRSWIISRLRLRSTIRLGKTFLLQGNVAVRQRYSLYRLSNPFSNRRDQAGAGLIYQTPRVRAGVRMSVLYYQQQLESRTYSANFRVDALPAAISLSGTASYWESDFGTSLYTSAGLARALGPAQVRLTYGLYRITYQSSHLKPLLTHRGSFNVSYPISRTFYLNINGSLQVGDRISSGALQTSLQVRF